MQIVHFLHMLALSQRHADFVRGHPFRRAFEQHADGLALQVETRSEHQNRHDK